MKQTNHSLLRQFFNWRTAGYLTIVAGMCGFLLSQQACGSDKPKPGGDSIKDSTCTTFVPVEFMNPGVPGFNFPEDSTSLKTWAVDSTQWDSLYTHAWGIWAGMTMPTTECYDNQKLLVFETWLTPEDVINSSGDVKGLLAKSNRNPHPIGKLRQFAHVKALTGTDGDETVTGFVKYNPAAATHIINNNLFSANKLQSYVVAGKVTNIPSFPSNGIALKPVFQTIAASDLDSGRYYKLDAWHGLPNPVGAYPSSAWGTCVWVDLQNKSNGTGLGSSSGPRTAAATFNLNDFIHFELNASQAKSLSTAKKALAAGNEAILVACHISTREFSNWTWQSVYWDATPASPTAPSSARIASVKPLAQLQGAAGHYSITVAYSMVYPATPTSDPTTGTPVFGFNPYLEAGFSGLPFSKPWTYNKVVYNNQFGVQTNCMSCHAGATYPGSPSQFYTADRYIDLNDAAFNGNVRTDFLWSIGGNAH